ncbi:MAG: hypothetical protein QOD92_354 [Acidimicrobiaceae bacterium]|jgi:hypothetical protein
MSAQPQGPGWWQASDGNWYPPQGDAAPAYAAPSGGIEVSFNGPLEVQNWRPLVSWLLAIPHFFMLFIYGIAAYVYFIIAFFQVLFTEQISEGTHQFIVKFLRYSWRVTTYAEFMRNDSPKYALVGTEYDPGDDPARLSIPRAQHLTRWGPLYKWILAIPHFIVLWLYGIAASVFLFIGFFQVLFTGTWSDSNRDFIVKVFRQNVRVQAYLLLSDEKPPISPE